MGLIQERRLEEFEHGCLNGVIHLFTAGLSVDACRSHGAMSQSILNGRKAAIGGNHGKAERVLAAMRMTFRGRHTRFGSHGLEHAEERRAVKFAAFLRDEHIITIVLPSSSLIEPRIQDSCHGKQRLTLHVCQSTNACARTFQPPDCDRPVFDIEVRQPQVADFARSHAKTEGTENHGVIALGRARSLQDF